MKSVLLIAGRCHVLFVAVLVMCFTTGCSKHDDDCPGPDNNDNGTEATTRAYQAGHDNEVVDDKPAGVTYRGAESSGEDMDGGGISDDGDDEADGEGNKKNRPAH